jgi:hypothetical protein
MLVGQPSFAAAAVGVASLVSRGRSGDGGAAAAAPAYTSIAVVGM